MALNLAGWFGAAIVGTLHTFYPSLTQTQLRLPTLAGGRVRRLDRRAALLRPATRWALDPLAARRLARPLPRRRRAAGQRRRLPASRPLRCSLRRPDRRRRPAVSPRRPDRRHVPALDRGPADALGRLDPHHRGHPAGPAGSASPCSARSHLLAVVVRVRGGFAARMPAVRPRGRIVAASAMVAIVALALAQGAGLDRLHGPAQLLLLAVYAVLLELARRPRPRPRSPEHLVPSIDPNW